MLEENNFSENENINEKAYNEKCVIAGKNKDYYAESIYALIEYMKENEENPSENKWNKYAIKNKYLSSKTIGYLSGSGFNKLCRETRKELNKRKRQKEE